MCYYCPLSIPIFPCSHVASVFIEFTKDLSTSPSPSSNNVGATTRILELVAKIIATITSNKFESLLLASKSCNNKLRPSKSLEKNNYSIKKKNLIKKINSIKICVLILDKYE